MTVATQSKIIEENDSSENDLIDNNSKLSEESGSDDVDFDNNLFQTDDSEADSDNDNKKEKSVKNLGWADSISKVLKTNKPKNKKSLVLSKAKKITDLKRKAPSTDEKYDFEIEGEIKEEKKSVVIETEETVKKKRKEVHSVRIKPNILDKDREKTLSKIATRGVVQLFNAVRTQQKDIAVKIKEAGPLERKRDKVLKNIDKRSFLNVLMGSSKSEEVDNAVKNQSDDNDEIKSETEDVHNQNDDKTASTWNVLRDDFMMGAKLKDWDKNLSDNEDVDRESIDEVETDSN